MPQAVVAVAAAIGSAIADAGAAIGLSGLGAGLGAAAANLVADLGFAGGLGAGLEAWGTIAAIAGVLLYKPKLASAGSFQQFIADPQAAIPVVVGRIGVAGRAIYQTTSGHGTKSLGSSFNEFLTSLVILSALGPIHSFDYFKANQTICNFSGQAFSSGYIPAGTFERYGSLYTLDGSDNAIDDRYVNLMWMATQAGANPSPSGGFPYPTILNSFSYDELTEWTSANKLSNFAAAWLTLRYSEAVFGGAQPKCLWTIEGISVYDPRQDSTYPGGSGSQRWSDPTTWTYSQNAFIHALNFLLGFWVGGKLYLGAGLPWNAVDVAAHVAGANVADANGWIIGGGWTTDDDKFAVWTNMLAAGSGTPILGGGMVSCMVNTPQTAIGTITPDQIMGPVTVDTSTSLRDRINRVFPRYHSEPHDWELVGPLQPVTGSTYVTEDQGRIRSKSIDYEMVTQVDQVAQLAAYDIATSREGIIAVLPGKPALANYPVGSCALVDIPDAGLDSFKMVVVKRQLNFMTGAVTLTFRSETDAKHAWCLGQSSAPPPTPQIGGAEVIYGPTPSAADWTVTGETLTDSTGSTFPAIVVTGSAADNTAATDVIIAYRQTGATNWTLWSDTTNTGQTITADIAGADILQTQSYDVGIAYLVRGGGYQTPWLIFTPIYPGSLSIETGSIGVGAITGGSQVALLNSTFTFSGLYGSGPASANEATSATTTVPDNDTVVAIKVTCVWQSGAHEGYSAQIYRDGTLLAQNQSLDVSVLFVEDDPGPGTYTYSFQLTNASGASGSITVTDPYIEATLYKR